MAAWRVARTMSTMDEWWRGFGELYLRAREIEALDAAAEDEAEATWKLLDLAPSARIVDAPCGFGRHAVRLATWGFDVWGIDLDPTLLAEARARAKASGAELRLDEGDIRALEVPDGWADAVVNLASSIGMFKTDDDNMAVFREALRVLSPGGGLLLETAHRDQLVRTLQPTKWEQRGDALILKRHQFDPVAGRLDTELTVIDPAGERSTTRQRHRVYSITELINLLRDVGFSEFQAFAGWQRHPATTDERLVLVAR